MTWTSDISAASKKLDIAIPTMVRFMALHIYKGAVERTPVDDGHLRAAWNISLNEPVFITTPGTRTDGGATLTGDIGLFPRVFITNGLDYAPVVEYGLYPGIGPKTKSGTNPQTGGGVFSRQAPVGMLEVTIADLRMNLQVIVGNQ